tara:strand:+ start:308 stop:724 length:417 start_codon:yes stop_codon:yes gene_type:complete
MTTAAAHADLSGYRADRADWAVYTCHRAAHAAKGPRYSLHTCHCGAQYLRALGVRGRPRSYCSNTCKDLRPCLAQFAALLDDYVARCERYGTDDTLLNLKAELMTLTQHTAMQRASGRRGQRALQAKRAAKAAAQVTA